MSEIKVGSVVKLKSGGPKMTVHRIVGEGPRMIGDEVIELRGGGKGAIVCRWFVGTDLKDGVFSRDALQIAE